MTNTCLRILRGLSPALLLFAVMPISTELHARNDCVVHAVFSRFEKWPKLRPQPPGTYRMSYWLPLSPIAGLKPSSCIKGSYAAATYIHGVDQKTAARLKKGMFISISPSLRLLSVYGETVEQKEKGRIWMKRFLTSGKRCPIRLEKKRFFRLRDKLGRELNAAGVPVYWAIAYMRETCRACSCPAIKVEEFILIDPPTADQARKFGYKPATPPKHR